MSNPTPSSRDILDPKPSRIQNTKGPRQLPKQSPRNRNDGRSLSTAGHSHILSRPSRSVPSPQNRSRPMHRPEMIRNLDLLTDEEEAKRERGLRTLWNHYKAHPEVSAQHEETKKRIQDSTETLLNEVKQRRKHPTQRQQSKQADQLYQATPEARRPRQSQQFQQYPKLRQVVNQSQESFQQTYTGYSTISRDCTKGKHAMETELLMQFGKKLRSSPKETALEPALVFQRSPPSQADKDDSKNTVEPLNLNGTNPKGMELDANSSGNGGDRRTFEEMFHSDMSDTEHVELDESFFGLK